MTTTETTMTETEIQAANFITSQHTRLVAALLNRIAIDLIRRGEKHDLSKFESPEVEAFAANNQYLAGLTFGAKDYAENVSKPDMSYALAHHYARNRHHPEHFENGVEDMTLVDLTEALVDITASSTRQNNGNIRKTLKEFCKKHNVCDQLAQILENTIEQVIPNDVVNELNVY